MRETVSEINDSTQPSVVERAGSFLCVFAAVLTFLINIDPNARWTDRYDNILVRYSPLILLFASSILFFVGGVVSKRIFNLPIMFALLLSSLMIIGGIYNLISGASLSSTYLGRGLSFTAILAGAIVSNISTERTINYTVSIFLIITGFIGFLIIAAHEFGLIFQQYPHILREESILYASGVFYLCLKLNNSLFTLFCVVLLIFLGVMSGKATIVLLGITGFVVFYVGNFINYSLNVLNKIRASKALIITYFLGSISVILLIISVVMGLVIAERATRYENDLRMKMWSSKFQEFLESPLYGQWFTNSPLYYEPLLKHIQLPTHNDPLDIMVGGGIIGFLLYIIAFTRGWLSAFSLKVLTSDRKKVPTAAIYPLILVFYAISALGNPVFSEPRISAFVMFSLGYCLCKTKT